MRSSPRKILIVPKSIYISINKRLMADISDAQSFDNTDATEQSYPPVLSEACLSNTFGVESDRSTSCDQRTAEECVRSLLLHFGEDPDRKGLRETPSRFLKSFRFFTQGYGIDLKDVVGDAIFDLEVESSENTCSEGMVAIRNIAIKSICEHHLLPFFGTCSIAYVPKSKIMGLSKFARVVDVFARRLQVI